MSGYFDNYYRCRICLEDMLYIHGSGICSDCAKREEKDNDE